MITPVYAALLALVFMYLSNRTFTLRRKEKIAVGTGESKELLRASRVHGNFAEYVPLTLILLYMLEQNGGNALFLHIAGALLLIGRIIHAYGVSQVKEQLRFRITGMLATLLSLGGSALYILALSLTS
ncbi:MAPEG family protein [Vibrio sp. SCSIO 43136]|uniref:MAPEG family protein n=1 Tax=Vibrio sp. SCSIO 43136 TaxID=2819101 RepID=UPI00207633FA|nr:MAPEG family protein [Vibrio sp. SCSIO 43136]USD67977.1 MAPEG family protein [Vibrio sp. SCSIO 43136]